MLNWGFRGVAPNNTGKLYIHFPLLAINLGTPKSNMSHPKFNTIFIDSSRTSYRTVYSGDIIDLPPCLTQELKKICAKHPSYLLGCFVEQSFSGGLRTYFFLTSSNLATDCLCSR